MKMTWHIARNELYSLFFSPVAWIMMILFLALVNVDYIGLTEMFLGKLQRRGYELNETNYLTLRFTAMPMGTGILKGVLGNLYMFMPLITMGLISREMSSGTIKLLYSSPIRVRQIVLGKYIGILCFLLCLMVLLCIPLTMISATVINVDYGQIIVSVIGLYIILSTYVAIGVFISSLTTYQVIAAIITFTLFKLLGKVSELWQDIDIVRHITHYLDIGGKSANLIKGLFNLRDVTYCLIITGGFLLFTIIRIKSGTESISVLKKALRYCAVIVGVFILGYVTSRPQVNAYYDATRNQLYTIVPQTQKLLAKLEGELQITAYVNLVQSYHELGPKNENVIYSEFWERFIRFKPDINIKYVYYYKIDTTRHQYLYKSFPGKTEKELAQQIAESFRTDFDRFLTPDEVRKLVDIDSELYNSFFVLKHKDKTSILRTFHDGLPGDSEVAASINRLIATPPKIAFLNDELERGPFTYRTRDYKFLTSDLFHRYSLINQGYDFDTVSLKRSEAVPTDIAALVIADPRTPIPPESIAKIKKYVDAGGNLYLSGEPDRTEITKPLFDMFGITARPGMIIQKDNNYWAADVAYGSLTDSGKNISPQFARSIKMQGDYYGDSLFYVFMPHASALDFTPRDGFAGHPLVKTNEKISWNRVEPIDRDSVNKPVGRLPSDQEGSFITSIRLNRMVNGKEQRIIVNSDADHLTSPYSPGLFNYTFGFWCMSHFSYGEFPTNIMRPLSTDNQMRSVNLKSISILKFIFYGVVSAAIAIIASMVLIRRKRK
jgi:ABC-2 type transport system permease protein